MIFLVLFAPLFFGFVVIIIVWRDYIKDKKKANLRLEELKKEESKLLEEMKYGRRPKRKKVDAQVSNKNKNMIQ